MSEFQDIQRLLRLKRFETPGEDFVEDFLTQFRERQRSEMLRQSARGLLWERVSTYFDALFAPKWGFAMAGATATVSVVAAWGAMSWMGAAPLQPQFALQDSVPMPATIHAQPALAVDSELISKAEEGRQIEIESILLSRHFEDDVANIGGLPNMDTSNAIVPVSAEMRPVSGFNR